MDNSSLQQFPNLQLLCNRDEKQKLTILKLASTKPYVVQSLDIYAHHMDEYLKEQRRRIQYLKKRETHSVHQQSQLIYISDPSTLNQIQRVKSKQLYVQSLKHKPSQSQKVSPPPQKEMSLNFDKQYSPLKRLDKFHIPALQQSPVSPPKELQPLIYKFNYYIQNNDQNVREAFKRRSNWVEIYDNTKFWHFQWMTQYPTIDYGILIKQDLFTKRKMINYLEFQSEITSIAGLYNTIRSSSSLSVPLPVGFVLNFKINSWPEDYDFIWMTLFPNDPIIPLGQLYVPTKMGRSFNNKDVPQQEMPESFKNGQNTWVLKPQNIPIRNGSEFQQAILKCYSNNKTTQKEFVIQKCLEQPLLKNDLSFTLHFLVFQNHEGSIYFCEQGMAKNTQKQQIEFDFNNDNNDSELMDQIKLIISNLFLLVKLNRRNRKYTMQIFEFIFIMDINSIVYLESIINPNYVGVDQIDAILGLSLDLVYPRKSPTPVGWIMLG